MKKALQIVSFLLLAIPTFGQLGYYGQPIPFNSDTHPIEAAQWCLNSIGDTINYGSTEDNSAAIILTKKDNIDSLFRQNPNRYKAICLMGVREIPPSVSEQQELEVLTIFSGIVNLQTGLETIHESLTTLPKLREIRIVGYLSSNAYHTLFANPNIEVIKMSTSYPLNLLEAGVKYPPKLKEFWSSYALLATPAIEACPHLKVLANNWRFLWFPYYPYETMSHSLYSFWPKDSLPSFYYSFSELEVLDLTTEINFMIDDRISNLGNLRQLILSSCEGISPEIIKCQNLKHIKIQHLGGFFNENMMANSIVNITSLESVEVQRCFDSIPPTISNLSNLKKWVINSFEYRPLPNEFSKLQHITHLSLGGGPWGENRSYFSYSMDYDLELIRRPFKWSTLPSGFRFARDADTVKIHQGSIKDWSIFEKALDLQMLRLSFDRIESLPKNFGNHKNLKSLYLWGNSLRKLPSSFSQITQLEILDLAGNTFRHFPKELLYESSPVFVDLCFNQIKEIPEDIWKMERTDTLILSYNRISKIPPSIIQMKNLKYLDLSGNPIDPNDIPAEMKGIVHFNVEGEEEK